jgi:hypothetical protein
MRRSRILPIVFIAGLLIVSCRNNPVDSADSRRSSIGLSVALPRAIAAGDIDSMAAFLSGDGIIAETFVPISVDKVNHRYSGSVQIPVDGSQWTLRVEIYDASGRKTGEGSVLFDGTVSSITVPVIVSGNAIPVIDSIYTDTTILGIKDRIYLFSSATDSFGGVLQYEWKFGDGVWIPVSGGDIAVIAPSTQQTWICSLRVTDDDLNTVYDALIFNIETRPPSSDAGQDTTVGVADTINLHGTGTDESEIAAWDWDIGNTGTFVTCSTGEYTAVAPSSATARYECVLRVTDDDGNTAFDTVGVFVSGLTYGMRLLPGGSFIDNLGHTATVSPFFIDTTEVTRSDWDSLMVNDPSWSPGEENPVEGLNWYSTIQYCNERSKRDSLDTVYSYDAISATSAVNLVCHWDRFGYRLPTEDEWEYACRAGTASRFYWGDSADDAVNYAWYSMNSDVYSSPVAQKAPNDFGLYDMAGNVWEFCWDWSSEARPDGRKDYTGAADGLHRVVRGGAWYSETTDLGSGSSAGIGPDIASYYFGMRMVLPVTAK